jgi:hypothetical protein
LGRIDIFSGRSKLVEHLNSKEFYVENDVILDGNL